MDIKNVFLHGDLSEVVCMRPPPGVFTPPGHVCRLHRAIYNLIQAPCAYVTPWSCGYGDVTATYIRRSKIPSHIYAKH